MLGGGGGGINIMFISSKLNVPLIAAVVLILQLMLVKTGLCGIGVLDIGKSGK